MLYLLDANVLIDANRDYYPMDRVPEFWSWLSYHGEIGNVKIPQEIHDDVKDGKDLLGQWARDITVKEALLLGEVADVDLVQKAIDGGYAADLSDDEIEEIGSDAFLVAYGLVAVGDRCIVTTEVSSPRRRRANRKLPDVCDGFGIPRMNTYQFLRALDFKTNWKGS